MKLILILFIFLSGSAISSENFLPASFTASFEQVYLSTISKKEKKSWGELSYKYPSNVRFEVEKPKKVLFVSNISKSWIYRPPFIEGEKGELTIKNTKNTGLAGLLDALKMGLKNNKLFKIKADKDLIYLYFNSNSSKRFGVKQGLLKFKGKHQFSNLKELKVTYPDDHEVTFRLSHIDQNKKFKKEYFTFLPPKNTNITN